MELTSKPRVKSFSASSWGLAGMSVPKISLSQPREIFIPHLLLQLASRQVRGSSVELGEKIQVVAVKKAHVRDPVAHHGQPLHPHAESKTAHFIGVIAHGLKNIGVHH